MKRARHRSRPRLLVDAGDAAGGVLLRKVVQHPLPAGARIVLTQGGIGGQSRRTAPPNLGG